jgi:hypothetical protein
MYIDRAAPTSGDFGSHVIQKRRPAGHKAQISAGKFSLKHGHEGLSAYASFRSKDYLRPIAITLGLPAAVSRASFNSSVHRTPFACTMAGRVPPLRGGGGNVPPRQNQQHGS